MGPAPPLLLLTWGITAWPPPGCALPDTYRPGLRGLPLLTQQGRKSRLEVMYGFVSRISKCKWVALSLERG